MRKITKGQVKVYQTLQNDVFQHFVFGGLVYVITFCVFAIHAWQSGAALQNPLRNNWEAFIVIFREALIYTLLMGVPVYVNFFLVYKRSLQFFSEKRYLNEKGIESWRFYLFLMMSGLSAAIFALPVTWILNHYLELISPPYTHSLIVILLLIICTTGISFVKDMLERSRYWERKERQETIARRKRLEQELLFIKKQIRPHFLFNTLQNLQILAKQKSDLLPDLMAKLSKLLRYLLYRTNEKRVPLDQELDFIRSYIELEKIQMGTSTEFSFEVMGEETQGQVIAPMILLIFVENCFKHYNKGSVDNKRIDIHIEVKEKELILNTSNTFKPNVHNENTPLQDVEGGLGLASVEENLRLIYKENYQLKTFVEDNQIFKTSLKLPLTYT
ncbi:MAG: sensor histidine kinase [Chitinophagales bacterium]